VKELSILNVKITHIGKSELIDFVRRQIEQKEKTKLYTVNNEFIVDAQKNARYRGVLNNSTISVADSTGVVWAAKKLFKENIERLPGADLTYDLLELANDKHLRVFLLGGSSGVGEMAKKIIKIKYPLIKSVDCLDGVKISPDKKDEELLAKINKTSPDMIFVALGSPKQEFWIDSNEKNINSSLFIGVGGTLDFISGKIKRAPDFMRKSGLEWLYRLFRQPSRFARIFKALVTFVVLVNRASRKT